MGEGRYKERGEIERLDQEIEKVRERQRQREQLARLITNKYSYNSTDGKVTTRDLHQLASTFSNVKYRESASARQRQQRETERERGREREGQQRETERKGERKRDSRGRRR